jgi:hypothetical protein
MSNYAMIDAIVIKRFAPDADPRWVEAWMRLDHSALDGTNPQSVGAWMRLGQSPLDRMSTEALKHAIGLAVALIAEASPDQSEQLALAYGL